MEDIIKELEAKCSRFEALFEMQDRKIHSLYELMNKFSDVINSNNEKTDALIEIIKKRKGQ